MRVLFVAVCLAICGAPRAQEIARQRIDLSVRRDPLRLLVSYGLVGGLTGAAVGGGFAGVMGAAGQGHDFLSVLATSAGIGLVVGVVWGIMDAEAAPPPLIALRPARDGLSYADQHRSDRSGTVLIPLFGQRF